MLNEKQIDAALQHVELPARRIIDPLAERDYWLRQAEHDGSGWAQGLDLTFTFITDDDSIQAYAIYHYKLIAMTTGCFNFICTLCDEVVGRGLFGKDSLLPAGGWKEDHTMAEQKIRKILKGVSFAPEKAVWKGDKEREAVFLYLVLSLFRFILLHEMGHFAHDHGQRNRMVQLDMDAVGHQRPLTPQEALDSQARELIADKFALDALERMLLADAEQLVAFNDIGPFIQRYLSNPFQQKVFALSIAYMFFIALDGFVYIEPERMAVMTHPISPFRVTTLVSIARTGAVSDEEAARLNEFLPTVDQVMAYVLGRRPNPDWFLQLDHPFYKAQYGRLYNGYFDKWAVTPQKAPISNRNPL